VYSRGRISGCAREPMTDPRGRGYRAAVTPSGWIRRSDIRLAVMCGLIQIAATAGAAHHASRTQACWWASACRPAKGLDAGAYALLALGPVALVFRRRYVREVLAFVFVVTAAYVALGYPLGPNFLSLGLAIVSALFAGERLLAWAAVGLGWLVFLGLPWALGHSGPPKVLATPPKGFVTAGSASQRPGRRVSSRPAARLTRSGCASPRSSTTCWPTTSR
jgi:hypothetical protein